MTTVFCVFKGPDLRKILSTESKALDFLRFTKDEYEEYLEESGGEEYVIEEYSVDETDEEQ